MSAAVDLDRVRELMRVSERMHRLAAMSTGEANRSVMDVAKAADAALIAWTEAVNATSLTAATTAIPTAALERLRKISRVHNDSPCHLRDSLNAFLDAIDKAANS